MITDTQARKIASDWHGGGGTALYAFASTGAIDTARADHYLLAEINACAETSTYDIQTIESINDLVKLDDYVDYHGPRGPVPGWADLTW